MSRVTRIEIHFRAKGEDRVATITPGTEGRQVRQIVLDAKDQKFDKPKPPEIELDDGAALGIDDGPQVCYMIGTERVCW